MNTKTGTHFKPLYQTDPIARRLTALVLLFLFNLLFLNSLFADHPHLENIIVFGDSLSDIGNNTWITLDGITGTPITNPNKQNRPYLWVNYLTQVKLNSQAYPSRRTHLNPFHDNISYAYASADTSDTYLNAEWPQTNPLPPAINPYCREPGLIKNAQGHITSTCVPGLLLQVAAYLSQTHYKPNPKTVFIIWSGANDLLNYYTSYMKHPLMKKIWIEHFALPSRKELNSIEQLAVDRIHVAKNRLIQVGVNPDRIYILNMPDLSKTPSVQMNNSWALKILYGKKEFEASLRTMSLGFNQKLQSSVANSHYAIPASHYIQLGDIFDNMIEHPDQYHLTNVNQSCIANQMLPTCEGYLFYNSKHPTTYVNDLIAENILSALDQS